MTDTDTFAEITQKDFEAHKINRPPTPLPPYFKERYWFKCGFALGVIIFDSGDSTWNCLSLLLSDQGYRGEERRLNFNTLVEARAVMKEMLESIKDKKKSDQTGPGMTKAEALQIISNVAGREITEEEFDRIMETPVNKA